MKSFRVISLIEGISYLILVFIAMPLKYLYGNAEIVKILGMVHGLLFVLFLISLIITIKSNDFLKEKAIDLFYYSLVPFGFLLIENILKKGISKCNPHRR